MKFAVKSINTNDQGKRKQFKNDLRVLLDNRCPFLIHLYGVFFSNSQLKFLLEYMDLGSLDRIVKTINDNKIEPPCMPEVILSKMTFQVLNGLAYLHNVLKQVHRDIKPANVLMNSEGLVKITDFGISKSFETEEELAFTFVGTRKYMSPERLLGKEHTFTSDIWSLGLIVYELMTGDFPFKCKDYIIMMNEMNDSKKQYSLKEDDNRYSDNLKDFIIKCLQKNPNDRSSAISLLNHPWIQENIDKDDQIDEWLASFFGYQLEN